jgi:hypothetical protein
VVRGLTATAALAAALAGCGGGDRPDAGAPRASAVPTAIATTDAAPAARTLVYFQRQGAAGATLDTITVRADGTATHEKRYGGAGGRFRELVLRRGALPRLRRALAGLPRGGSTLTRGSPPPGGANYLLRIRGRTLTGRAGAIAPRARPAVKLLDGFIDGIGVREYTREHATSAP